MGWVQRLDWRRIGAIAGAVAVGLAVLAGGARLGLRTDAGRALVVRMADGLALGPVGTLHVAGLKGDVLGTFSLDRLSIRDAKGDWLQASNLNLKWHPAELLVRRFHAESLGAGLIRVIRAPAMKAEPAQPPANPPVSVLIDAMSLRVETLPEVSVQHGLFDVRASIDMRRSGQLTGAVNGRSLSHPGDGLELRFRLGVRNRFLLRAEGVEAAGGALSGLMGFAADRRMLIHTTGDGDDRGGRLTAEISSGEATPVRSVSTWSKAGAAVDARVDLGASHWTRFLAERMGASANLHLSARQIDAKKTPNLYQVAGALVAPDGHIAVDGPFDASARAARQMRLDVAVSDLSRWVKPPKAGATHTEGVLDGTLDAFTYTAALTAADVDESGVKLARLQGPAKLVRDKGEWRIFGALAGSGGQGSGLLPNLFGATPSAKIDLSILKDGRLLIRSLDIAGANLKVQASGGQGLLGRLSLKGALSVANVAAVRPGARGSLTASWDAGEAVGGKAWDFTFDAKGAGVAKGAGFGIGIAELDRLLGASPRLTAKAQFSGAEGLKITRADLTGGAVTASARGALAPRDVLALDVDWSAKGPFTAGPVVIQGAVKGQGKITGTLEQPRADLTADLGALDFDPLVIAPAKLTLTFFKGPDAIDGVIAVTGLTDKFGPASAKAAFRVLDNGFDLSDIVADAGGAQVSGAVALRNGQPSSADLSFTAGPGAFLTRGKLSGRIKLAEKGADPAVIDIDGSSVAGLGIPGSIRNIHLHAAGPLTRLPYRIAADSVEPVAWSINGSGIAVRNGEDVDLTFDGSGKVRKAVLKTLQTATFRLTATERSGHLHLVAGGGRADIDAVQAKGTFSANAVLAGVSLAPFTQDYAGKLSGTLTLGGKGPRLDGALDATLEQARSRDAPQNQALNARIRATLAGPRLHIDADAANPQGLTSTLALDLAAEAAADPFRIALDRSKPIGGHFTASGEMRPLWDLLAGGDRTLSGLIDTQGQISGTLNDPKAIGQASLKNGKLRDVASGLSLQDLAVESRFDQDAVTINRFAGADGHAGSMSGSGQVGLTRGGASTFQIDLKRFQLLNNDIGRATASGAVTVTRDAEGKAALKGALNIDRADFVANPPSPTGVVPMDVVEIHQIQKEGVEVVQARNGGPTINLDVTIKAAKGVFVRGKGLEVEMSLDSHVGGTASKPDLSGIARVVRGSYDFAGKRFDMDDHGYVRLASNPAQIRLDLTARWDDPTLVALVEVKGTAAKPEVTLSSTPVLPPDEVLSRVLFGVSAAQLSPAQGAQLASALASLAGGGGFDIIGNLRQFAGLDRLALGGTQLSGPTVSGGKYLTDNVYLELTGGGREGPSAQVEWRVRRNLSLVSRVGTQGDARLSVRLRKDF